MYPGVNAALGRGWIVATTVYYIVFYYIILYYVCIILVRPDIVGTVRSLCIIFDVVSKLVE